MFAALGRFTVRFRWLIIAAWVVVTVVLTITLPSMSSVEKNSNSQFLPSSSASVKASELAAPFSSSTIADATYVAAVPTGSLTSADNQAIDRAEQAMRSLPKVTAVVDEGASANGRARTALVEAGVPSNATGRDKAAIVAGLRSTFTTSGSPPGLAMHLTGSLAQSVDQQNQNGKTQTLTEVLSVLFIMALLFLTFRALLAPLVALLPSAVALIAAGPIIAVASRIGVQVSDLTPILLVVVLLGAGTDYGLFLIFRVREELRRGKDVDEAVAFSLCKVGESITFSGLTVIGALATVVVATFGLYQGLGPALAIGIAVALVANLTLLPALLAVLGRSVFWPRIPRPGTHRGGTWGRIAGKVVGRPVLTLVVGLVIFGGLAVSMLAYAPSGFNDPPPPATSDSGRGQAILTADYPSAATNPTDILFRLPHSVWSDPQLLATAQRALSRPVRSPRSPVPSTPTGCPSPPPPWPRPTPSWPASDPPPSCRRRRPTPPRCRPPPTRTTGARPSSSVPTVGPSGSRRRCGQDHPTARRRRRPSRPSVTASPVSPTPSGPPPAGSTATPPWPPTSGPSPRTTCSPSSPSSCSCWPCCWPSCCGAWSPRIYLVVSVGLSYLASLGLAVLVFELIGGQDGINFVLPFFMFIFIMALGQDYNILVMTRIREEAHHAPIRVAVKRAVEATGTTVTSAGLILAGTFGVLTATGNAQVQEIGLGLAAGILLDTFLVRTLLVPSVVVLLGRWNWWPSKLSRRGPQRRSRPPRRRRAHGRVRRRRGPNPGPWSRRHPDRSDHRHDRVR